MLASLETQRKALERAYPVWNELTIWERFAQATFYYGARPFVELDGQSKTYEEILAEVEQATAQLNELGVGEGSHVATIMDNSIEFVVLTFALARLGAVKIPLNTKLSVDEWRYLLRQSEAELLLIQLHDPGQAERICTLCRKFAREGMDNTFPKLRVVASIGVESGIGGCSLPRWEELSKPGPNGTAFHEAHVPNQPSDIIYTSGCTGRPKGVLLTHDMLCRSAYANCLNRGFEFGRRIFIPLPLFHVYGYVEGLLAAILVGGTILLTQEKCTSAHMLDIIERQRANDILAVPSLMMEVLKDHSLPERDLSSLHAVYCSASVCPRWVWGAIRERLGIQDVITGYGMTEVCGATIQTAPEDPPEIAASSVGRILPAGASGSPEYGGLQAQYKVVDPVTGKVCPPGTSGELWCRGLVVTKGYYQDPRGTAAMIDAEGWLHTGDVGQFDERGYLHLEGRTHDVYKINGENVSPKLIEDIISDCPNVKYVEVVGVPDPKAGESGAAFLELEAGARREEVIDYCKTHLGHFQVPKYFFFSLREVWPQTATGKVQKGKLRAMAQALLRGEKCGEGAADFVKL